MNSHSHQFFLAQILGVFLLVSSCYCEDPNPSPFPKRFVNSLGQRFVLIAAGDFEMGPSDAAFPDQKPRHPVSLSPFYMAALEVTKGEFKKFAKQSGIEKNFPELDPNSTTKATGWAYTIAPGDSFPVYHIDWNTSTAFAKWLSNLEGKSYRLPTEAEWEYACRAGTDHLYWWGDQNLPSLLVNRERDFDSSPYVGIFIGGMTPSNPWGLYDVLGNAPEWTADWYAEKYTIQPANNPTGPSHGVQKVIRGGGFLSNNTNCFYRGGADPADPVAGIRLVCDITPDFSIKIEAPSVIPAIDKNSLKKSVNDTLSKFLEIAPGKKIRLQKIMSGTFIMGSPDDEVGHGQLEQPRTLVTISHDYFLGQTEITQDEYQAVTGNNPSVFVAADKPVDSVSFHEAIAFCEKLTGIERGVGAISTEEIIRLPTEPEWEFAARGGSQGLFFFGEEEAQLDQFAWFDETEGTHPVAEKFPNQFGLYDIHGNVSEWCWGGPCPHPGGEVTDPRRRPSPLYKQRPEDWDNNGKFSVRGGAWSLSSTACRCAMRQGYLDNRYNFVGFRIELASINIDTSPYPEPPRRTVQDRSNP